MNFNKVILGGILADDVSLKYLESGMAIGTGIISVSEEKKDKQGNKIQSTSNFEFTCFGETAIILANNSKKDDRIVIDSKLKQEKWTDKNNKEHVKLKIVASQAFSCKAKNEIEDDGINPGGLPFG